MKISCNTYYLALYAAILKHLPNSFFRTFESQHLHCGFVYNIIYTIRAISFGVVSAGGHFDAVSRHKIIVNTQAFKSGVYRL